MDLLALTTSEFAALTAITLVAGIVRGFTGFALSAVVMATAVTILPPVELIPMLWWLEGAASLLMVRAGWREADRRMSFGLVIGSAIGLPVGLALTLALPVDTSRLIALTLVCVLAASQLARLRLPFLATRPGLLGSGFTAGMGTGLAGLGGMVVALYTLAIDLPGRVIRASLVLYLAVSICIAFFTHLLFGTMTQEATLRGLAFAVPTLAGVKLGQAIFIPAYEPYYKPACLSLLIALASVGITRQLLS